MSIHIAIVDDDSAQAGWLKTQVAAWASEARHSVAISTYGSAEAFRFALDADEDVDVLLLDIQMSGMDGVTLAKELRAAGYDMPIAFITGFGEFVSEGYEVAALHYLMKPVSAAKLREVLDRAVAALERAQRTLLIDTPDARVRVRLCDILCVEAFAHTVAIQTPGGVVEARMHIGELEQKLGDGFVRCHRSYIVNLEHVRLISKDSVRMDNGRLIPLSRRLYAQVNRGFIAYYKGDVQ